MIFDEAHSTYNLELVTLNGSEVVVTPPIIVYSDGSQLPLSPSMKIGSVNARITSRSVSAISGNDGKVYSLPAESISWVNPSAKVRKKATTSAGKFKQTLENK